LEPEKDVFDTNTKYCYYDQTHNDYQYTYEWVNFVVEILKESKLNIDEIKEMYKSRKKIDINDYE
jgi:hypothetical protein